MFQPIPVEGCPNLFLNLGCVSGNMLVEAINDGFTHLAFCPYFDLSSEEGWPLVNSALEVAEAPPLCLGRTCWAKDYKNLCSDVRKWALRPDSKILVTDEYSGEGGAALFVLFYLVRVKLLDFERAMSVVCDAIEETKLDLPDKLLGCVQHEMHTPPLIPEALAHANGLHGNFALLRVTPVAENDKFNRVTS